MAMTKKVIIFLVVLFIGAGSAALAEKYPARPITNIVPFGAGSGTDLVSRALASSIDKYLRQPFIIQNKPGGGGTLGVFEVVKSKPDGYTVVSCGATIVMPELYVHFRKDPPYTYKDLAPVAGWTANIIVMAVRHDAPWNSLKDFMENAKTKEVIVGSPGSPSLDYIMQLALTKKYNAKVKSVPFKAGADMVSALLGGHIDMGTMIAGVAKAQVDAKALKLLAVVYEARVPFYPDVPTMAEQGYDVGISSFPVGTFVHRNTAPEKIKILSEAIKKTTEDESFKATMKNIAMPVVYDDTGNFRKKLEAKKDSTAKTFKELGFLE